MVQRFQPLLHVHAGAHGLGRPDQHADAAGVEIVEQALLVRRFLEILHEGDLGRRHTAPNQFLLDPAIRGEAPLGFDGDRAEVGEDQLPGTRDRVWRAVRADKALLAGLKPNSMDVARSAC